MFNTHSGLQPLYGSPEYSGKHVHDPAPFLSLHIAFGPHGEGLHGSLGNSGCIATIQMIKYVKKFYFFGQTMIKSFLFFFPTKFK